MSVTVQKKKKKNLEKSLSCDRLTAPCARVSVAPSQENYLCFFTRVFTARVRRRQKEDLCSVFKSECSGFHCHLVNKNELYPGMQRDAVKRRVRSLRSPSRATYTSVRGDENAQNAAGKSRAENGALWRNLKGQVRKV